MKALSSKGKIAVAAAAMLSLSASASYAETPSWCGPKKATIALLDGFGGNSWRLITTAAAKEEALKCPSITQYEYADGQGNTQKAISDIKSIAARGIDALVVFGDAGPAVLPALTSAYKAGKVVVPYRVTVGGEAGKNYSKFVGAYEKDGRRELGQLDQEHPAERRQCAVHQRAGRQQPGSGRTGRSQVGSRA